MSIPERLADAQLLLGHDRNEGALLSVLVAVGATAQKRYEKMRDCEAYCTFLQDEFKRNNVARVLYHMDKPVSPMPPLPIEELELPPSPPPPRLGDDMEAWREAQEARDADVKARIEAHYKRLGDRVRDRKEWGERQTLMPMGLILYALCRCGLCHKAELDPRVSFVDAPGLSPDLKDQHLKLPVGWIARLATIVIGAPENAHLFSNGAKLFWKDALTAAEKDPEHEVSPQLTHERT